MARQLVLPQWHLHASLEWREAVDIVVPAAEILHTVVQFGEFPGFASGRSGGGWVAVPICRVFPVSVTSMFEGAVVTDEIFDFNDVVVDCFGHHWKKLKR